MFLINNGTVVEVERLQGVSKKSGAPYDFWQAHVLVGKSVFACSIDEGFGPLPKPDEKITCEAGVSSFNGRVDIRLRRRVRIDVKDQTGPVAAAG